MNEFVYIIACDTDDFMQARLAWHKKGKERARKLGKDVAIAYGFVETPEQVSGYLTGKTVYHTMCAMQRDGWSQFEYKAKKNNITLVLLSR